MTQRGLWLLLAAMAAGAVSIGRAEDEAEVFYLPFEGTLDARDAGGDCKPSIAQEIAFDKGIIGQGAVFEKDSSLAYATTGNLNKPEGTIEFWIKPRWAGDDNVWHAFFIEDGPYEDGENTVRFWKPGDMGLRFDPCHAKQLWLRVPYWEPNEWHHLVGTWDSRRRMSLYVDGSLSATALFSWPIKEHRLMYVGSPNPQHREWGVVGAEAVMDELRIYSRALTGQEIAARYAEVFPFALRLPQVPPRAGVRSELVVAIENRGPRDLEGILHYRLEDSGRRAVIERTKPSLRVKARSSARLVVPFTPEPGRGYLVTCTLETKETSMTQKERLIVSNSRGPAAPEASGLRLRLIQAIDCVSETRPEVYRDDGKARVVNSALGAYREAGEERNSRFAYRFRVEKLYVPHLLVVEYPDDKDRTMAIDANSPHHLMTWDIATGVSCGGEFPNTNRFHEHKAVFWPREQDNLVVLMTCCQRKPAAARSVKIYEVEGGLPVLAVNEPKGEPTRLIGHQWEDASLFWNFGSMKEADFGEMQRALSNMIDYFRWTGQNLFMYPLLMYWEVNYPSQVESWGDFRTGAHAVSSDQDWVALALEMFEKEGIYFIPSLTLQSLPSLLRQEMTDVEKVKAGAETINMVLANNGVRRSCDIHGGGTTLVDPERAARNQAGPAFNPLHPKVQQAALTLIQEIVDRYGHSPAFKGLAINFWGEDLLWFGNLRSGYGDLETELFEKETGLSIPVPEKDPERFSKRYQWLMAEAKDRWIAWRCQKVRDTLIRIRDILLKKRPDLQLVLASWVPYPTSWSPEPEKTFWGTTDISQWVPGKRGLGEITREGGIDFDLYKGDPNIVIERQQYPGDLRWREAHEGWSPEVQLSRDINFDSEVVSAVASAPNTYVWFYNRYFENVVGKEQPLPNLWWEECPWRGTAIVGAHKYFMENYAFSMAALDVTGITNGGTPNGTIGHEEDIQRFAQAYRALPARKFSDVPGASDPVTVRYLNTPKQLYLYLVNRSHYPVGVKLTFKTTNVTLIELATRRKAKTTGRTLTVDLRPYELQSYGASPGVAVEGVRAIAPEEIVQSLNSRLEALLKSAREAEAAGKGIAEGLRVLDEMRSALAKGHYAEAHYLSESYWVRKQIQGVHEANKQK